MLSLRATKALATNWIKTLSDDWDNLPLMLFTCLSSPHILICILQRVVYPFISVHPFDVESWDYCQRHVPIVLSYVFYVE